MQTNFTLAQLTDPQVADSEKILRACVHCGFCTATCPTYVLLGDELDSPRGRIYLIKEMLEQDRPATADVVKHIDRCLSCLSCMTTCPSGVHYMHLVDHAREHIEKTYKRPLFDRAMRGLLARVLSDPALFRLAVVAGLIAKPFAPMLQALGLKRMAAMLRLTPRRKLAPPGERTGKVYAALGTRRGRVALLVRLHQSGAGARDQRGRHPPAQPQWHRGGGCCRRGLLRLARPSHGPRRPGAGAGAQQYRRLDARNRWRRPRCHPDHGVRLRNHGKGLRLHAARRPRLCRARQAGFPSLPRTSPNI